jgi:hypothetical protein
MFIPSRGYGTFYKEASWPLERFIKNMVATLALCPFGALSVV